MSKSSVSELPETVAEGPDSPVPMFSVADIVSSASEICGDVRVFVPSRMTCAV